MRYDIKGHRFGRWFVLRLDVTEPRVKWVCKCDCGTERSVDSYNLRQGLTRSCGCLNAERGKARRMANAIIVEGEVAKIVLGGSKGKVAIIDTEDLDKLRGWRWGVFNGYAGGKKGRYKFVYMHRLILGEMAASVDHRDGDCLNNRKSNLRATDQKGNGSNRKELNKNNTSGYHGVTYSKDKQRWRAQIKINYQVRHLGYFEEPLDAARAYDEAAKLYHGEYATLNEGVAQ